MVSTLFVCVQAAVHLFLGMILLHHVSNFTVILWRPVTGSETCPSLSGGSSEAFEPIHWWSHCSLLFYTSVFWTSVSNVGASHPAGDASAALGRWLPWLPDSRPRFHSSTPLEPGSLSRCCSKPPIACCEFLPQLELPAPCCPSSALCRASAGIWNCSKREGHSLLLSGERWGGGWTGTQ